MCTVVILLRPDHEWPVLLAANRDEMVDRPWRPPARHWPDRAHVVAGLDELAGGTWLGLNDDGVLAGVLNRRGSLGPDDAYRSRGELPLEALDHAEAATAAAALSHLEPNSYRPFNMVVADARRAFWLRSTGAGEGSAVEAMELAPGLSMVTAHDLNDTSSARIGMYLPRFTAARVPDPAHADWSAWTDLLASREHGQEWGAHGAMCIAAEEGFGTVCSTLLALPAQGRPGVPPVFLFAPGRPGEAPFEAVET